MLTLSWRFIGIRQHFWCLGWKSLWKLDLAAQSFDLPMREIRLRKFLAICSLISDDLETVLTWLLCSEEDCVTARPRWSNRSLPMRDLRPSATTVKVSEYDIHPLLVMGVYTLPSIWIGSLENVLSCGTDLLMNPDSKWTFFHYLRRDWSIKNNACTPGVHEKSSWDVNNFDKHIERIDLCYVIFN